MPTDYEPPPTHEVPEKAVAYVASMSPKERELHEMAIQILGSSYFVEYSHGYVEWLKAQGKK
jgi:hypothetical protein